jgi:hypothetical protein
MVRFLCLLRCREYFKGGGERKEMGKRKEEGESEVEVAKACPLQRKAGGVGVRVVRNKEKAQGLGECVQGTVHTRLTSLLPQCLCILVLHRLPSKAPVYH